MAETAKQDGLPPGAQYQPPKPPPKQNPVFRMMGMPNFRWRLPSRNWTIFLSVTGSFAAAVTYDRRQKKAVQKKWCDLVAHIAQQPLPVAQMPRKITVFISAPPGDGIRPSRDFFRDYVKPVLVAAAMDYDVIEGRKEGDVRYGTAEQIRRLRRRQGEAGAEISEEEPDKEQAIEMIRDKMQVRPEPGLRGDLVLGRHTWKEYIRGIHEGWLGPLNEPPPPAEPSPEIEPSPIHPPTAARTDDPTATIEDSSPTEPEMKSEEEPKEKAEKKKPFPPPSYLPTELYSSAPLSPHIPSILEPSTAIHQQHMLGFLKTPIRIYNFLNRRRLADEVGRETAAIVLGAHRPYQHQSSFASTSSGDVDTSPTLATQAPENDAAVVQTGDSWEQQSALVIDEAKWHKSVWKPRKEDDRSETIWKNEVVLDPRIAERMRRFDLDYEEQERAQRIASGAEKTRARPLHDMRSEEVVIEKFD